jgi:sugar phosphate permease
MALKSNSRGIFYGWWIIAACFMMSLYISGVLGYGFTAVINPIMKEFGWSSAQVSIASSMRGVEAGLFAPFIGMLIDRYGSKWILLAGGVITGIGMILLSRVDSLLTFYLAFGLIAVGTSAVGVTTFIAAVANWFHRRLGLAMGIMVSGFGSSGLVVVPATMIIDSFGWRTGMLYFAIGTFLVCIPLSLTIRNRPEDYGLLPDGDTVVNQVSASQPAGHGSHGRKTDKGVSVMQAVRSRNFWLVALALSAQHLVAGGVITHVMPYLSSLGYSREFGSYIAAAIPLTSIIGRFGFGWLSDRVKNRLLTMIGFALITAGMVCFAFAVGGILFLLLFLLFFTIGFGGTNTMRAILPRTYFGFRGYGTYVGLITGVGTIGSMFGAPLAGYTYDIWRTYEPIWLVYSGVALVCFLIVALLPSVQAGETIGTPARAAANPVDGQKK